MPRPSLVVHGGAWTIPDADVDACLAGCRAAAWAAWAILGDGGSALDAVQAAVTALEDDPIFDAGRGSHLNRDGEVELDAIIMDGRTLGSGAAAAVQRVRNPVSLARLVLEHGGHSLLVGAGAEAFARQMGVPECPRVDLVVERELELWRRNRQAAHPISAGTVGAVARDADGHVAAATSTGGTVDKLPGRVGDSPLVGCGAYADDLSGAASATGAGEALMKIVISKAACDLMGQGRPAQAAAEEVIRRLADRTDGRGGIIVVDRHGNIGHAHNTPRMALAWVGANGEIEAAC